MKSSIIPVGIAAVVILLYLLPGASGGSSEVSVNDIHPLVDCLYNLLSISIYPSLSKVPQLSYHCYNVIRHYANSDVNYIEEIQHLAKSGYTKAKELLKGSFLERSLHYVFDVVLSAYDTTVSAIHYYSTERRQLR